MCDACYRDCDREEGEDRLVSTAFFFAQVQMIALVAPVNALLNGVHLKQNYVLGLYVTGFGKTLRLGFL